jgi:hypothetical protein
MKRKSSSLREERKIIRLGYLWRRGSVGLSLLVLFVTIAFCEKAILPRMLCLTLGSTLVCIGIHHIVGMALGFKHLLVACQIALTPFRIFRDVDLNPRRDLTPSEKREFIGIGIISTIAGLIGVILFFIG